MHRFLALIALIALITLNYLTESHRLILTSAAKLIISILK